MPKPTAANNNSNGHVQWKDVTLSTGLVVQVQRVNPMLVQRVSAAYKVPKRPVYEVKTISGKIEYHPMDEQAARETPGGLAQWEEYLLEKQEIEASQNQAVTNALLVVGTKLDEIPTGWEEIHRLIGLEVPDNPDARRGYYLATQTSAEDVKLLVEEIMKLSGVSEAEIQEAENSF